MDESRMSSAQTEQRLSYQDFSGFRNALAFWPTREIAYPGGEVFAYLAYRAKLTPNMVSVAGFLVGIAGAAGVYFLPIHWGGVYLAVMLTVAYMLDCADGVLARATGRTSEFGCVFDKVLDSGSCVCIPVILSWGHISTGENAVWFYAATSGLIAARIMFSVLGWLKDERIHSSARMNSEDQRNRSIGWYVRRSIGALSDEVVFRFALGAAWAFGVMFHVFGLFFFGYSLLLAGSLWVAKRDLEDAK